MDGTAGWGNLTGLSKGYGKKFTLSAFDNFDHSDKSTLSGKSDSHDTVITLFQEIPDEKQKKLGKSEVNLKEIKSIEKLSCQQLVPYSTDKSLVIPETFTVQLETFASDTKKKNLKQLIPCRVASEEILITRKYAFNHGQGHLLY